MSIINYSWTKKVQKDLQNGVYYLKVATNSTSPSITNHKIFSKSTLKSPFLTLPGRQMYQLKDSHNILPSWYPDWIMELPHWQLTWGWVGVEWIIETNCINWYCDILIAVLQLNILIENIIIRPQWTHITMAARTYSMDLLHKNKIKNSKWDFQILHSHTQAQKPCSQDDNWDCLILQSTKFQQKLHMFPLLNP